jgi:SAM-dependent methyltransferase
MITNNTKKSFDDKWHRNTDLLMSETLNPGSEIFKWIMRRNGWVDLINLKTVLSEKKRILDAGCGNGRVSALLREASDPKITEVVCIDLTSADVAKKNLKHLDNMRFENADLMLALNDLGSFDFIYCQEVLHHTSNPAVSFSNLVELLSEGGEIVIYVYKQKAPIREFTDDYVRDIIKTLSYEEAMKYCEEITNFGKVLAKSNVRVTVPEVRVLGIEAGEYDFQRLIYHFFAKCFWNESFDFNTNAVINYDWYHPQTSTRHNIEEVTQWFIENDLKITHMHSDPYGITMHGIKM